MRRLATIALLVVLTCFGVAGWLTFQGADRPATATIGENEEPYSDLSVIEDEDGGFAGTITIHNPSDSDRTVLIFVNLYDGEQNVGELSGDVTLRPDSKSVVELWSVDPYVDFTEARVKLM